MYTFLLGELGPVIDGKELNKSKDRLDRSRVPADPVRIVSDMERLDEFVDKREDDGVGYCNQPRVYRSLTWFR